MWLDAVKHLGLMMNAPLRRFRALHLKAFLISTKISLVAAGHNLVNLLQLQ